MRDSTIALRRAQILAAATALVHSGIDPSKIQALRDLVVPFGAVKSIARFHYDRRAGAATVGVFGVLEALRQVAKYHVRLPADDVLQISKLRDRVRPRKEGIVARNRERLRPLQDERHRAALLHLPAELLRQAAAAKRPSQRARLGACAVALEILLFCPLRISNLVHLRLDLHLRRTLGNGRRLTHIVIAAEETKNAASIDWPIPPASLPVMNAWISRYRGDSGCTAESSWLFPGKFGGCRAVSSLRLVLEQEIARVTGLEIHPHLLRHFAAMLFLSHNPGHYETVRRVLGHKSLKTTIDSYMPAEADAAARRFDDVVLRERAVTRLVAQKTFHRRRGKGSAALAQHNGRKSPFGEDRS
jgi:integrase